jgi:hydroxyethylthiazole kinase
VTDGKAVLSVDNGVEMLTKVTAAGCSVTALIAAFVAAAPQQPMEATAAALAVFG